MPSAFEPPPSRLETTEQPQPWYKGPTYLRSGVEMRGVVLSFPIVLCLSVSGAMFLLSGILTLVISIYRDEIFDDEDDDDLLYDEDDGKIDPGVVVGIICILIGVWLLITCVALSCYAKKKFEDLEEHKRNSRVFTEHPSRSSSQVPVTPVHSISPPPPVKRTNDLPPVRDHRRPWQISSTEDQSEYSPIDVEQLAGYPRLASLSHPNHTHQGYAQGHKRKGVSPHASPRNHTADPSAPEANKEPSPELPGMALVPNKRHESEFSSPPPYYAPDYNPPI